MGLRTSEAMLMPENKLYWFAVYTKPRWEKKVARLLDEQGIENYCPLNKVVKQWSDRKKVVLEPLFKSYVFVRVAEEQKWELKKINGILNFIFKFYQIMFHIEKAHYIVDEMVANGVIVENNKTNILRPLGFMDQLTDK